MEKSSLRNILYAEDEEDILEITKDALESIGGFVVQPCVSGLEVLRKLETFRPHLILLDVMMPGMDGPTTLKEIRKDSNFNNIPVVFVTAKSQRHEIEEYKKLGATEIIPKPISFVLLCETLNNIWYSFNG